MICKDNKIMMAESDFRHKILHLNGKRKHKVTNSNGIKEAWRWIKKNQFFGSEPFTELQLGRIVKEMNEEVLKNVALGKDTQLPYIGTLKVVKKERVYKREDGHIVTNLQINWDKTLKLWESDEQSHKEKRLVYEDCDYVYHIKLFWSGVRNRSFYRFIPSSKLKKTLKTNIKAGNTDALLIKKS